MMTPSKAQPKFTIGEKCIFVHLIITFIILLLLLFVYFCHLGVVNHGGNEIFRITRRSFINNQSSITSIKKSNNYHLVGAVYLHITPQKLVCNSLLLRQKWSLAPAHCVSMYSEPEMIHLITTWRVKYMLQDSTITEYLLFLEHEKFKKKNIKDFKQAVKHGDTKIKRNIVHSQFDRDDFSNNIGLFEHIEEIFASVYVMLTRILTTNELLLRSGGMNNMKVTNWDNKLLRGDASEKIIYAIRLVSKQKCHEYTSPVVKELRNYEFCVTPTLKKEIILNHGAVVFIDSDIIGFFSWGDKKGSGVPFVVLSIVYHSNWLRNIFDVNNVSLIE